MFELANPEGARVRCRYSTNAGANSPTVNGSCSSTWSSSFRVSAPRPRMPLSWRRKLEDLEELFLLVIVGEFNSGKSAFINALLGEDELSREGVTPTTDRITVLKHGEEAIERERREGILEKEHPNEFLREVAIVDTPGTNAIIRHHEELSRGFVPRSDFVLFVTSSDRPFTESEREYLELIRDWGKKVVLVINKVDLLRGEEDV